MIKYTICIRSPDCDTFFVLEKQYEKRAKIEVLKPLIYQEMVLSITLNGKTFDIKVLMSGDKMSEQEIRLLMLDNRETQYVLFATMEAEFCGTITSRGDEVGYKNRNIRNIDQEYRCMMFRHVKNFPLGLAGLYDLDPESNWGLFWTGILKSNLVKFGMDEHRFIDIVRESGDDFKSVNGLQDVLEVMSVTLNWLNRGKPYIPDTERKRGVEVASETFTNSHVGDCDNGTNSCAAIFHWFYKKRAFESEVLALFSKLVKRFVCFRTDVLYKGQLHFICLLYPRAGKMLGGDGVKTRFVIQIETTKDIQSVWMGKSFGLNPYKDLSDVNFYKRVYTFISVYSRELLEERGFLRASLAVKQCGDVTSSAFLEDKVTFKNEQLYLF